MTQNIITIASRESENANAYLCWNGGDRYTVWYIYEAFCIEEATTFNTYEQAKVKFDHFANIVIGNNHCNWGNDAPASFGKIF